MTDDEADPLLRFGQVRRALEARWPESRISPTLERMRALTQYLGDPQSAYPVILVTGTNGKTSTARMIESLLRAFGLHTGLVTSPHLSDLRERIRLDGEPIDIETFLRVHDEVAPVLAMVDEASERHGGQPLSFFEVMTGLAYAAFADAPVDVAVVEVGMGGRWDATNVADAQVAVIGPVSLDHTEYLGETLAAIAGEKAGIIMPAAHVVLAAQEPEAAEVLLAASLQLEAPTVMEGLHFGVMERVLAVGGQLLTLHGLGGAYDDVFLPLLGAHQASNASLALAAVESFFGVEPDPLAALDEPSRDARSATSADRAAGDQPDAHGEVSTSRRPVSAGHERTSGDGQEASPAETLPARASATQPVPEVAADVPLALPRRQLDATVVRAGFAAVRSPGRLEVVRRAPTVVVDASHNPHGAAALADALTESFSFSRLVAVVGVLTDKDARGILIALAPALDHVVVTRSSSPRALPVDELAEIAVDVFGGDRVTAVERLDEALDLAVHLAETTSPAGVGAGVLVTGSITVVGEARLLLGAESGGEEGATRADHTAPRGRLQEDDE